MRVQHHAARLAVPISADDHSRGPAAAPVTLVEYGDYECPACGAAYVTIADLRSTLGDRFRFVFRNFPLSSVHLHAGAAARAAEAAALQGRFWEMHDVLYENQEALEPDDLLRYAEELGLDLGRFELDFQSEQCIQRVRHDFLGGVRSGVNGTPTFFINGLRHDGGNNFEALAEALERAGADGY